MTMEEGWKILLDRLLALGAPAEQVHVMRFAFFLGARHLLESLHGLCDHEDSDDLERTEEHAQLTADFMNAAGHEIDIAIAACIVAFDVETRGAVH